MGDKTSGILPNSRLCNKMERNSAAMAVPSPPQAPVISTPGAIRSMHGPVLLHLRCTPRGTVSVELLWPAPSLVLASSIHTVHKCLHSKMPMYRESVRCYCCLHRVNGQPCYIDVTSRMARGFPFRQPCAGIPSLHSLVEALSEVGVCRAVSEVLVR